MLLRALRLRCWRGALLVSPSPRIAGKSGPADKRWNLLNQFARLVKEIQPDLVTMENVPRLEKQAVFCEVRLLT